MLRLRLAACCAWRKLAIYPCASLMKSSAPSRSIESPATAPAFLTPAELAARWKVTTLTLRRWRHAGKLRALFLGGRGVRFAFTEIERVEREGQA